MQNAVSFYTDPNCEREGQIIEAGVAAATGNLGDSSNWGRVRWIDSSKSKGDILVLRGNQLAGIGGEITLSGGSAIYDCSIEQTIPYADEVETDTKSNLITTEIYNPFFISHDGENNASYALSIWAKPTTTQVYKWFDLRIYYYTQTPEDATLNTRETWNYNDEYNVVTPLSELLYLYQSPAQWDTNMRQIKMYKLTLSENEYYMFVFGVSAIGKYNDGSTGITAGTTFIAIPVDYFKDKEPKPWVGPTSEDDSEEGFAPPEGGEWHDSISTYEDHSNNPYLANNGSGLKIILPGWDTTGGQPSVFNHLSNILNGIYRGSSDSFLNMVGQEIISQADGNVTRPIDEIQAICNGIVCCHTLPVIREGYTSYITSATSFLTISGYNVLLNQIDVGSPGQQTVFRQTFITDYITPRLNCFLDYEPYTSIVLKIPFLPPISLPPSAVYNHRLHIIFKIDILTGFLHCDVMIMGNGYNENSYIYTTLEQNIKTDVPIMGAGGQSGVIGKIVSGLGGLVSKNPISMISSGLGLVDSISRINEATVAGKETFDGLSPYFASRDAYLIITHPKAAIPAAKEDGQLSGTFLKEVGMAANLGLKVSQCAGGWSKFSSVDLSTVDAPQEVKEDIIARLREGVYIK